MIHGMANGVMTIVRGLAVPEMLTREAYGALNGVLALPGTVAKALAPWRRRSSGACRAPMTGCWRSPSR